MESNSTKEAENVRYTVDLSRELSPQELERFQAEAALSGRTLKAYALTLMFSPESSQPENSPRRKSILERFRK